MKAITFYVSDNKFGAKINSKFYTEKQLDKLKVRSKLQLQVLNTLRRLKRNKQDKCKSCNNDCGGVCFNK